MSARLYDSPFRWLISSKSRVGEHHLVDLQANSGHGECSCEDFQIIRIKRIEAGEVRSLRTKCKHIQEAREALAVWIIDRFRMTDLQMNFELAQALHKEYLAHSQKVQRDH